MNTFVVRVYRCDARGDGDAMTGRVEHVETGQQYTFRELAELMQTMLVQAAQVDVHDELAEDDRSATRDAYSA